MAGFRMDDLVPGIVFCDHWRSSKSSDFHLEFVLLGPWLHPVAHVGRHRVFVSRSFAQLDRFQLQDGDVVGAEVRPPRSKTQRYSGDFQGTQDEHSWVPWQHFLGP